MSDRQNPTFALKPQAQAYYIVLRDGSSQIIGWQILQHDEGSPAPEYEVPDGYKAFPLPDMTADQWLDLQRKQNGCSGRLAYEKGKIVPYTPPSPPPIPLKDQAETALNAARTKVYQSYGMLNEPTPQAWVDYLKALTAISDGSDTTSTTLPTAPDDVTT